MATSRNEAQLTASMRALGFDDLSDMLEESIKMGQPPPPWITQNVNASHKAPDFSKSLLGLESMISDGTSCSVDTNHPFDLRKRNPTTTHDSRKDEDTYSTQGPAITVTSDGDSWNPATEPSTSCAGIEFLEKRDKIYELAVALRFNEDLNQSIRWAISNECVCWNDPQKMDRKLMEPFRNLSRLPLAKHLLKLYSVCHGGKDRRSEVATLATLLCVASDFNRPLRHPEDFEWARHRIQESLMKFSYVYAKEESQRKRLGNDPRYEQSDIGRVRNVAEKAAAAGCDRKNIDVSVLKILAAVIVEAKLDGWVPHYHQGVLNDTGEMRQKCFEPSDF